MLFSFPISVSSLGLLNGNMRWLNTPVLSARSILAADLVRWAPLQPVVLALDDYSFVREAVRMILDPKHLSVQVVEAETSEQALEIAARRRIDLVISDIIRPGMKGLEFLRVFKNSYGAVPVIITSAMLNEDASGLAYAFGAYACLLKPCAVDEFLLTVAGALQQRAINSRPK